MKWVISERKSSSYTFKFNLGIFAELISKNPKKGRHIKYDGTLRRFSANIVAMDNP